MKTILVVDDDAMFRAITRRQLDQLGYAVIENSSGVGVLEQIRDHQPVACLIDIVMDDKEGMETIMEIVQQAARPRIIAVSSNDLYLELAEGLGADSSLKKPVSPLNLKEKLSQLEI